MTPLDYTLVEKLKLIDLMPLSNNAGILILKNDKKKTSKNCHAWGQTIVSNANLKFPLIMMEHSHNQNDTPCRKYKRWKEAYRVNIRLDSSLWQIRKERPKDKMWVHAGTSCESLPKLNWNSSSGYQSTSWEYQLKTHVLCRFSRSAHRQSQGITW